MIISVQRLAKSKGAASLVCLVKGTHENSPLFSVNKFVKHQTKYRQLREAAAIAGLNPNAYGTTNPWRLYSKLRLDAEAQCFTIAQLSRIQIAKHMEQPGSRHSKSTPLQKYI